MASFTLPPDDPAYPPALRELGRSASQSTLFVRGALPPSAGIAVVGTRRATDAALAFARALARDLGEAGFSIWSGGARGIDAAAHEGALEIGAPTVVVAGGGLGRPYPPEHAELFERIVASGGALLARVPDDAPPLRSGFLVRNQILAALTVATVVVEAGVVSGARSTAAAARRLGRPLCVVPHAPWDERGAGCTAELRRGAVSIESAADVIAALRGPAPVIDRRPRRRDRSAVLPEALLLPHAEPRAIDPLGARDFGRGALAEPIERAAASPPSPVEAAPPTSDRGRVLSVLWGDNALHVDQIAEIAGLPYRAAVGALLTLTLQAVVVEGPAGFYRRVLRS